MVMGNSIEQLTLTWILTTKRWSEAARDVDDSILLDALGIVLGRWRAALSKCAMVWESTIERVSIGRLQIT